MAPRVADAIGVGRTILDVMKERGLAPRGLTE
jgi:hypothetical protein